MHLYWSIVSVDLWMRLLAVDYLLLRHAYRDTACM